MRSALRSRTTGAGSASGASSMSAVGPNRPRAVGDCTAADVVALADRDVRSSCRVAVRQKLMTALPPQQLVDPVGTAASIARPLVGVLGQRHEGVGDVRGVSRPATRTSSRTGMSTGSSDRRQRCRGLAPKRGRSGAPTRALTTSRLMRARSRQASSVKSLAASIMRSDHAGGRHVRGATPTSSASTSSGSGAARPQGAKGWRGSARRGARRRGRARALNVADAEAVSRASAACGASRAAAGRGR